MKTAFHKMRHTLPPTCLGLASLFFASVASNTRAATMIDSVTHSANMDLGYASEDAILLSFTVGGVVYSSFSPATGVGVRDDTVFVGDESATYPNPPGTLFPSGEVASTDLNLTTGPQNLVNGTHFQFSELTASSIVYLFDSASTDAPTLALVDGSGVLIPGEFKLSITRATWGDVGGDGTNENRLFDVNVRTSGTNYNPGSDINGIIFSISEFKATVATDGISIGDSYSGTNATGIGLAVADALDVVEVGIAIPEPGVALLFLSATGLLALGRRR